MKLTGAIIYLSSNKENPEFEKRLRDNILKHRRGLPIFSVTQKPIDFGENYCVGDVGASGFNFCRQLQLALKHAYSDYVIQCESDCLYPPDYFTFVPPKEHTVYRNTNICILPYKKNYFHYKSSSTFAQVAGREYLLARLNHLLDGQPMWSTEMKNFPKEIGKPFLEGWEEFTTRYPAISFKTGDGMRKHSASGSTKYDELPYWGSAKLIRKLYLNEELDE